jgi:hypothetical protein
MHAPIAAILVFGIANISFMIWRMWKMETQMPSRGFDTMNPMKFFMPEGFIITPGQGGHDPRERTSAVSNMNLIVSINDDLDKVSVELTMDGLPLGHIFLHESGVDQTIKNLQKFKSLLKPKLE